ncbi:OB-fold nucleic acid binding domain-containing protein, partial [Porphyromonas gulae]
RKTMESLALAGAFDSFGLSREEYMAPPLTGKEESYIQALMRYGSVVQEEKHSQSNSLFGEEEDLMIPRPQPSPTEPWNDLERLNKERELVGLYLSSNPMAQYQVILDHYCNTHATDLADLESLVGKNLIMAGIVTKAFQGISRSNNPYSKITLEDLSGTGEIPLFGQSHVNFCNYCKEGLYLLIRASVQPHKWKQGELELTVNTIELLPQVADTLIKKMTILLPASKIDNELIETLSDELTNNSGKTMLFIKVYDHTETFDVELAQHKSLIKVSPELVNRLKTYEINFALE